VSRAASLLGAVAVVMLFASIASGSASSLSLSSQNLTPYRTCLLSGTPTTTTTVSDASVRQASGTSNFGTSTTNDVASASSANRRLYVRFDLAACSPAIPSTATVRLATLRMYASALPAVCRTLDVFRVTATWTESGLTWNNQPFGTTLNNPPSASRTTSFDIGTPVGCQYGAVGFTAATVTSDVATWVSGSATNFGWMLRDDVESSSTARTATFAAKNLNTPAQVPELVISYVTVL
jgi:hypothetical protein